MREPDDPFKCSLGSRARNTDTDATKAFSGLEVWINNWTGNHCCLGVETFQGLSTDEKQSIVAALDGYCVQESLDSIIERLSDKARLLLPRLLAEAWIWKSIFQTMLVHPFVYFEGEEEVDGENTAGAVDGITPTLFGTYLNSLYKRFVRGMLHIYIDPS